MPSEKVHEKNRHSQDGVQLHNQPDKSSENGVGEIPTYAGLAGTKL